MGQLFVYNLILHEIPKHFLRIVDKPVAILKVVTLTCLRYSCIFFALWHGGLSCINVCNRICACEYLQYPASLSATFDNSYCFLRSVVPNTFDLEGVSQLSYDMSHHISFLEALWYNVDAIKQLQCRFIRDHNVFSLFVWSIFISFFGEYQVLLFSFSLLILYFGQVCWILVEIHRTISKKQSCDSHWLPVCPEYYSS